MSRDYTPEERIALAMLPLGGTMMLVSAIAFVAVAALGIRTLAAPGDGALATGLWCLAALAVAAWNVRRAIETMSSFAWRSAVPLAPTSVAILATFPGWW